MVGGSKKNKHNGADLLTRSIHDPSARSVWRIRVFRRFTKVVPPMSTRCRCCDQFHRNALKFTKPGQVQVSACQATLFFLNAAVFPNPSGFCTPAPIRHNPIACAKNPGQFRD
ncbi:hypothetical protein GDO81_027685 [Engystomops pustulosus]|uniref:Uncharacterized protein n=1 Tax=Engystomops pustulosus TaxID=76066 RepID=A0AAV6YPW5_ENGPU|nr:hypothetical protein GDO81_027685 [Engystomops pustulosus]